MILSVPCHGPPLSPRFLFEEETFQSSSQSTVNKTLGGAMPCAYMRSNMFCKNVDAFDCVLIDVDTLVYVHSIVD